MQGNISEEDRNVHIRAVVKSNIIGFSLSNADIDSITHNLTTDLIDVIDNYTLINDSRHICNGEF